MTWYVIKHKENFSVFTLINIMFFDVKKIELFLWAVRHVFFHDTWHSAVRTLSQYWQTRWEFVVVPVSRLFIVLCGAQGTELLAPGCVSK